MSVDWTEHRFSGGVLALDVVNTVVHRSDARRRFDRFDEPAEIARFARAASIFRREEVGSILIVSDPDSAASGIRSLREAIDALYRPLTKGEGIDARGLALLARECAAALEPCAGLAMGRGTPIGGPGGEVPLQAALAVSALSLLSSRHVGRLKACPNCDWLFLDRSRNASRLWCDMAVCGNRAKARRHYRLRKDAQLHTDAEGLAG